MRTKKGVKFVLDYFLEDPWEQKKSCAQNFIPFNCYLHFSSLKGCWGCSKTLTWFLDPLSYTIRLWLYKLFVHSRTVSLQLKDNDAWEHSFDIIHTQQICDHVWLTVRITFWSINVLQLHGDLSHILFSTFQDIFPAIKEQRYRYRYIYLFSFPHTFTYMLYLKKFLTIIWCIIVLECMKISYNRDLRMQLNQVSHH